MPATGLNKETMRWLTSFNRDSKPGDIHCISVGNPFEQGEFTTYRLGPIVTHDQYGPLFDLKEADIGIDGKNGKVWFAYDSLRAMRDDKSLVEINIGGAYYIRNLAGYGTFRRDYTKR